jgi:aspartate aminotransferase
MRLAARALNISPSPTLTIDAQAKKMQAAGIQVINFSAGEPDFDTPEHIKQAAITALNKGMTKYTPVAGTLELKEAIRQKLKTDNQLDYQPEEIVVTVGAKHALYNTLQVLCGVRDEVILPAPYWVSYLEQIKLAESTPVIVPTKAENNFKLTPEELTAAINERTKLIILNSPGNPTGTVYTAKELAALGEILVKHKIYIISDEIYEKLIYDQIKPVSIAALDQKLKELTVVVNGVSKTYAMTGWRIGYAAAPLAIAKAMADLQSHCTSNPTSIAQAASVAALSGSQEDTKAMVAVFQKRRDFMYQEVSAIPGVSCNLPQGAFYLFPDFSAYFGKYFQEKEIKGASDLASVWLENIQVAVIPGIAFGDDRFVRLSYATSLENIKEGLNRIKTFLARLE